MSDSINRLPFGGRHRKISKRGKIVDVSLERKIIAGLLAPAPLQGLGHELN